MRCQILEVLACAAPGVEEPTGRVARRTHENVADDLALTFEPPEVFFELVGGLVLAPLHLGSAPPPSGFLAEGSRVPQSIFLSLAVKIRNT